MLSIESNQSKEAFDLNIKMSKMMNMVTLSYKPKHESTFR